MGKKSGSGIWIWNATWIIFPGAKKPFFGLKYLISLMRIREGTNSDAESGMKKIRIREGKFRIRDKHPGSATLIKIEKKIQPRIGILTFSDYMS
jgi:hypothetical protein